ncbi:MAG: potassium-transporting ATPase subunit KdpC [Phycisphaeraceae bacterium]
MKDFLTTLRLVMISMLVCCVIYPAIMLGFGQLVVPDKAEGSLLRNAEGQAIGSALLAQKFERPEYFWPRPSAVDYNASATGGSNLSPTNPKLGLRAAETIRRYDLQADQLIPADLVAASGSGMDPHISLAAAHFQAPRVAAARGLALEQIQRLIDNNCEIPTFRVFGGEPVVNVLKLNLAIDKTQP